MGDDFSLHPVPKVASFILPKHYTIKLIHLIELVMLNTLDPKICQQARLSRDARFDGLLQRLKPLESITALSAPQNHLKKKI